MTPEYLRTQAVLAQKFARQHREHDVRHARAIEGIDHVLRLHQGGAKDNYARARAAVDAWLMAEFLQGLKPLESDDSIARVVETARAELERRVCTDAEGAPTKPMRAVAVIGGPDTKARVLTDAIAKEDET